MANSIEAEALKKQKRIKIGKIVAAVAAVLLVAWSIYCVAANLNKKERRVYDAFIEAFYETKEPALAQLKDCSAIYEGQTGTGKTFKYVIAEIEQNGEAQMYLMIVSGKNKGNLYSAQTLQRLDFPDKENVPLEIRERDEDINLAKVQRTLLRYWKFHDVA